MASRKTSEWLQGASAKEGDSRFKDERSRRIEAERERGNTLLTKQDLHGEWNAGRVLFTTLGGELRPLTPQDLRAFRRNMEVASNRIKTKGITAQQIIDLASVSPLKYKRPDIEQAESDLDKARKQIKRAVPISMNNALMKVTTNSGTSGGRHHVRVHFNAFPDATIRLMALKPGDRAGVKKVARWLIDQPLSFDCDCERHTYFLRYVATVGGFAYGRQETAFPKIRNPELKGVACKHVLRVMAEIRSNQTFLNFVTRALMAVHQSSENKGQIRATAGEKQELLKKRIRNIKTSEERDFLRREAAKKRSVSVVSRRPRTIDRSRGGQMTSIEQTIAQMRSLGASDAIIQAFQREVT